MKSSGASSGAQRQRRREGESDLVTNPRSTRQAGGGGNRAARLTRSVPAALRLLGCRVLPELLHGLSVDRLQRLDRAQNLGVALEIKVTLKAYERHSA